jgi:hypothetical protein
MQNAEYRMQNEMPSILHSIFCILHSSYPNIAISSYRGFKSAYSLSYVRKYFS